MVLMVPLHLTLPFDCDFRFRVYKFSLKWTSVGERSENVFVWVGRFT